jgi:hypothetical protein
MLPPSRSFRSSAAFGKRIEFYVVGLMLKEVLDVYLPLVDDDAIDAVVKRPDGSFVEVQIKARSSDVKFGDAALFAAITHEHGKNTQKRIEHVKPQFQKFVATDFKRILTEDPNG